MAEALLNLVFGLLVLDFRAGTSQATPGKRLLGPRVVDARTGSAGRHAPLAHPALLRHAGD